MTIMLRHEFESERYEFKRTDLERMKCMPTNQWFDIGEDTLIMRIPGFLCYRVRGHQMTRVPFKGDA